MKSLSPVRLALLSCRRHTGILLATICGGMLLPGLSAAPVVRFSVVVHNEDFHHLNRAGQLDTADFRNTDAATLESYSRFRSSILALALEMQSRQMPWNLQNEWNFLEGVYRHEITTPVPGMVVGTNGDNIIHYLRHSLPLADGSPSVEMDPHSHEAEGYTYADVAYLHTLVGVTPSGVVGGHINDPASGNFQHWDELAAGVSTDDLPLAQRKFPSAHYTWQPTLLMGGTPGHFNDPSTTGIWRPLDINNYNTHSETGVIPAIGLWTGTDLDEWQKVVDALGELIRRIESGQLDQTKMWTAGVVLSHSEMAAAEGLYYNQFVLPLLDALATLRGAGKIEIVHLEDAREIWQDEFGGQGAVFSIPDDQVTFSLNWQDFLQPGESVALLDDLIDLHEAHQVPVDVFLTTEMVERIGDDPAHAALFQRLRTSPMVAVNYHVRSPKPWYNGEIWYDQANTPDLRDLPVADIRSLVLGYEQFRLVATTGLPGTLPGGYEHLGGLLGYAPFIVGPGTAGGPGTANLNTGVDTAFQQLGARMIVSHEYPVNVGETRNGGWLRPEADEVRLFETQYAGQSAAAILDAKFAAIHAVVAATPPHVLGIKIHDNDFFSTRSAWLHVYRDSGKLPNQWNFNDTRTPLDAAARAEMLARYTAMVVEVATHRDRYEAVNARGLLRLLGESAPGYPVASPREIQEGVAPMTATFPLVSSAPGTGQTWSLVPGPGDEDNPLFLLEGTTLRLTTAADYEQRAAYRVRVRVQDEAGLFSEGIVDLTVANRTDDDDDGDGRDEAAERVAGTDPLDPASCLRVTALQKDGPGAWSLAWSSVPGKSYWLETSLDLRKWDRVEGSATLATGAASSLPILDFSTRRFYRVAVSP